MELFKLGANWKRLSDNALAAKLEEIDTHVEDLLNSDAAFNIDSPAQTDDEGETTAPSGMEVGESLAEAKELITAELAERAQAREADEERRQSVLSRLEPAADPEEPEEEDDSTAEMAVEDPEEPEDDDEDVEPAVADPEPATLAAEETSDPEPLPDPEPEPQADPEPAAAPSATSVLRAMNSQRTPDERPRPSAESRNGRMQAAPTLSADGWTPGQTFDDLDELAVYMADRINKRDKTQWTAEQPQRIPLMTSVMSYDDASMLVASDSEHNYRVTDEAIQAWRAEQNQLVDSGGHTGEALVAAGGPCAPLMPTYEFPSCFSIQRPVEAGMPSVGAPRGGIRFLNQVPINSMAGGVTVIDAATGAILPGNAGYTPKDCVRVTCPTETEVTVAAVSRCVTFDNLNFRVFPEQVRHYLELLQLAYTERKEVFYLDRLDTFAGAAVDIQAAQANPMGAVRSLLRDMVAAGHNYRKRNNMSRDAILDVWLPDVVEDILLVDAANDYNNGGIDQLARGQNAGLGALLAQRARLNVMYYYYDSSNGGFPASAHNQAAGAWNPMPSQFRSYMHAPGAVVRLDGGSLDLGIVRDSTLNAQNDLQMFAEEWIEVARPGCEVVAFDHTACYSGVGPAAVAAPACP